MATDAQLDEKQPEHFRRDASAARRRETQRLIEMIRESVPDPDAELCIADFGGGDGRILDGVLDALPRAKGTLVDLAQEMVDANRPHPRKVAYRRDLSNLDAALPADLRFDVVLFNVVLHHCLATGVQSTRALQKQILSEAGRRLAPDGRILVLEQIHESPVVPDVASLVIYKLTKSRLLAPLTGRFGANTAGVGVLFASQPRLRRLLDESGMERVSERMFRQDKTSWVSLAVACTNSQQNCYVLRPR